MREPDVLIAGGGMAGLAAAVKLKDRGLMPLVVEASDRPGGRMTSDRVNGYVIDTGVTLLGNRFRGVRELARRSKLPLAPVDFSLAIQKGDDVRSYRARRPGDLLLDPRLSLSARLAAMRLTAAIAFGGRGMLHGNSHAATEYDRETVGEYLSRLGRGGEELLAAVFEPGLRAALGGAPAEASRLAFMQVMWNTLGAGFWNFDAGVGRLPETLAKEVEVEYCSELRSLEMTASGVEAEVQNRESSRVIRARAAILALPGGRIPAVFAGAPSWIRECAEQTEYSALASAHVALGVQPKCPHTGYGLAAELEDGVGVLELEHHRAPGRCPKGKGMVSIYFVDSPTFSCMAAGDDRLREKAFALVRRLFPESATSIEFIHLIRWPTAIAKFPAGRFSRLATLERQLCQWEGRVDLAGDWLDGVSSESAVQTGFRAADRIARRLAA